MSLAPNDGCDATPRSPGSTPDTVGPATCISESESTLFEGTELPQPAGGALP